MLGRALERRGAGTKVDSTDIVQELSLRRLDYSSSYKLLGENVQSERVENKDLEIFWTYIVIRYARILPHSNQEEIGIF